MESLPTDEQNNEPTNVAIEPEEAKIIRLAKKYAVGYVEGEAELITKLNVIGVGMAVFNLISAPILIALAIISIISEPAGAALILNGVFVVGHITQIVAAVGMLVFTAAFWLARQLVTAVLETSVPEKALEKIPPMGRKLALFGLARLVAARTGMLFTSHLLATLFGVGVIGYRIFF